MKFMTMVTTTNGDKAGPPPPELMNAIMQLGIDAGKAMVENGGMQLTATARIEGGELIVDGPYAEAKEAVGGYAIYVLDTTEEAIEFVKKFLELHRKHWPAWEGEVLIRQIFNYGP